MSLITGDAHSAQIVALRDTELLRVGPEAFDALPGPVWSLAVAATLWVMLAVVRVGRRAGRPAAGRPVAA